MRISATQKATPSVEDEQMSFIAQDMLEQAVAGADAKTGAGRRWRAAVRLSAYILSAGLFTAFVTDPLIRTAQRVYDSVIHDHYALYRARLDQEHLREVNSRLKSELVALKSRHTKQGSDREQQLGAKLDKLEAAIESATALGFFKRGRNERGLVVAKDSTNSGSKSPVGGKLAAVLASPQLNSKRTKDGVGGAEESCGEKHCQHQTNQQRRLKKQNVALYRPEALELAPPPSPTPAPNVEPKNELLDHRLDRAIAVVRGLPLGAPVAGHVSSSFGHRRSPFSKRRSFHHGIDLSVRVGGHVMATGDGRVTRIAHNHTYGALIDIEHSTGLVTRYAHLSRIYARAGQQVKRGQVIAASGNTGRSTGPHLHYEVIRDGKAINPAPFIALADRLTLAVSDSL